jgi:type III secretion system HrpB4-like protein
MTGSSPAQRGARALSAWERNACAAFSWAHPSWIAGALAIGEAEALMLSRALGGDRNESLSHAFLQSARLPPPDLEALAHVHVARLDALPIEIGLRVLRLRALRFRRSEVRRIVDKRTRTAVLQWAGIPLDRLTNETDEERLNAPDVTRLSLTPVALLDADTLALEGHALIARDLNAVRSPCPLLRLALPCASTGTRWIDALPRDLDAQGTQALIARLPEYLPEWSWLFG